MVRVTALLILVSVALPSAQKTAAFDVVSVKRNVSGVGGGGYRFQPGGRFVATSMPPLSLILSGYGILRFQLAGVPDWVEVERYDINAVAQGDAPDRERQGELLRTLLAERFKLVTHKEVRTLTGQALVRDRADGRLGPQLKAVAVDCDAVRAAEKIAPPPVRRTMADFLTPRPCSSYGGAGMYVTGNVSMNDFARELISLANVPVTNDTGLPGDYEVVLRWNPDPLSAAADPTLPSSLAVAVREQLGLRLESRPQRVDVIVIDKIERPTEN